MAEHLPSEGMLRPVLLAVLLALALAPASAGAQVYANAWQQTSGVLVAPEGTVAYAADAGSLLVLRRDPATGALRYDGGPGERRPGGSAYELSPDGHAVYVASDRAGRALEAQLRNSDGTLRDGPSLRVERRLLALAFTHDGRTLLAAEDTGYPMTGSVLVLRRDPATDTLTSLGRVALPPVPPAGSGWARTLAISPDDRFAYVGDGSAVHVLALGADAPQVVQSVGSPGANTNSIALAPDGTRLYAGPYGVGAFSVDPGTGGLTALPARSSRPSTSADEGTSRDLAVAPDGRVVWAADRRGALHQATVTSDGVADGRTYANYEDAQGLADAGGVTVSPDGAFVYVAAGGPPTQQRPSRVVVFRREASTNTLSFASDFEGPTFVPQRPPEFEPCRSGCGNGSGRTTVTINGGAAYTNDPHVTLTVDPGVEIDGLFVDNDGGMGSATRFAPAPAEQYAWTLRSTGPERQPKSVYVRTHGVVPEPVVADDIVLDETRPTIVSAVVVPAVARLRAATGRQAARRLRVVARDRTSGVRRVQLARSTRRPRAWQPVRSSRAVVPLTSGARWVRVADRAGNRSAWRRIGR